MDLCPFVSPPPPLHSNRAGIVSRGAREPSLSVSQIYSEGRTLSFSCAFAGWTRWYYWCIAVYFRFLPSKALHRTLYHAEHFSVPQFQPWMLIILTRTQPVLLSISNLLGAVFCLPRLCLPQGLEPTANPPAKPAPKAAKPRAKPSTKSAARPAAQVAAKSAAGEPSLVAPAEHVQLFTVKYPHQKKWHIEPVSELNMHPNRQFLAHFVVHMPLCLHALFRVANPLHSNRGEGEGTVIWGMFPWGSEDTVARRRSLCKGGRG